jgi:hypothetical protein
MTDFAALAAPFAPACVSWRVGSTTTDKTKGMALAFINSRDVQDRLDEVCGPGNWQDRYEFHGPRTICYLSLRIDGEWVTKADGAGDSDVESEKGAISDALKRAAVKWGVGRYLYHLPSPWVEVEQRGRSSVIKQAEYAKLERLLASDAKATAPAAPKASSAAVDFAIATMRTSRNLADLTDFWTKNAKGLRSDLAPADFAKVEKAKDEEKVRLTPPTTAETPFTKEAPQ